MRYAQADQHAPLALALALASAMLQRILGGDRNRQLSAGLDQTSTVIITTLLTHLSAS